VPPSRRTQDRPQRTAFREDIPLPTLARGVQLRPG
jgi:hypothetical protein